MREMTYPRGFKRIGETLIDARQLPFDRGLEHFPDPDVALVPLIDRVVPRVDAPPPIKGEMTDFHARSLRLAQDFEGQPELVLMVAQLVMILRRHPVPPEMLHLWFRVWEDCTEGLYRLLSARWKVACLQCFSDHGRTEGERRTGSEMVMLAAMIKLYEAERLYSGVAPTTPHPIDAPLRARLPMGLEPYSLLKGDIDRHLLARLWKQAEATGGPAGALAMTLLDDLNADKSNVFRRLIRMRAKMRNGDQAE